MSGSSSIHSALELIIFSSLNFRLCLQLLFSRQNNPWRHSYVTSCCLFWLVSINWRAFELTFQFRVFWADEQPKGVPYEPVVSLPRLTSYSIWCEQDGGGGGFTIFRRGFIFMAPGIRTLQMPIIWQGERTLFFTPCANDAIMILPGSNNVKLNRFFTTYYVQEFSSPRAWN